MTCRNCGRRKKIVAYGKCLACCQRTAQANAAKAEKARASYAVVREWFERFGHHPDAISPNGRRLVGDLLKIVGEILED